MSSRALCAAILAATLASAGAARGDVEEKATGGFMLTLFRALPSAWVPEQVLDVHATGVVSASASSMPSGALIRLTFPFPDGERAGVLRLDLSAPAAGRVYAAGSGEVEVDYYEVGPSGPELRVDRVDGTVEVLSWSLVPQVAFALRFESWGPDGQGGTGDDQARELTDGYAGAVAQSGVSPDAYPVGSPAVGGIEVIWGDPWPSGPPSTSSSGSGEGCSYDDDDDDDGASGCGGHDSGDEPAGGGGCGGESDASDTGSGGCEGDDDEGACESDAEASPRSNAGTRTRRLVPRAGNLAAFLLLLAAVHGVRRRGSRAVVTRRTKGDADPPSP